MSLTTTSQKRIDANRRNALRSTGPRTAEGKAHSSRNSLVHGMAAETPLLPEAEARALSERADTFRDSLKPIDFFELSLVETIAVESLRIERCRREERLARANQARKAAVCWADDRRAAIIKVAAALADRPEEVAAELNRTSPGCDWLIGRWTALGRALDLNGAWTDTQASMALDLLGIAPALRDLPTPIDPDAGTSPLEHRQALVDAELERLWDRKQQGLDVAEEIDRQAAIRGMAVAEDRSLALIRRYEAAAHRRLKWALGVIQEGRPRRKKVERGGIFGEWSVAPLDWADLHGDEPRDDAWVGELVAESLEAAGSVVPQDEEDAEPEPELAPDESSDDPEPESEDSDRIEANAEPIATTPRARAEERQRLNRHANLRKTLPKTRRDRREVAVHAIS